VSYRSSTCAIAMNNCIGVLCNLRFWS